jgi:hypothetical protein
VWLEMDCSFVECGKSVREMTGGSKMMAAIGDGARWSRVPPMAPTHPIFDYNSNIFKFRTSILADSKFAPQGFSRIESLFSAELKMWPMEAFNWGMGHSDFVPYLQ